MSMKVMLGIDAGGTHTRAVVSDLQGSISALATIEPLGGISHCNSYFEVRASFERLLSQLKQQGTDLDLIGCTYIGSTNIPLGGHSEVIESVIAESLSECTILMNNDSRIALAGAFSLRPGIVAVAGTGAIALGMTKDKRFARASGLAEMLASEGGGFYIGHRGLRAVVRALDRRGKPTCLVRDICKALGIQADAQHLATWFKSRFQAPTFRKEVAALCPVVTAAAMKGDSVSRTIVADAGRELGLAVVGVARQLNLGNQPFEVAVVGGLLALEDMLIKPFQAPISSEYPSHTIVARDFEPVIGAILLGIEAMRTPITNELLQTLHRSWQAVQKT
jgi:N-acetylglucosamine kinase-like BadF-type ATPase